MKDEEILALLRLQKTKSIGDILAKKLIATLGNAADIFSEKKNTLHKINGIGSYAIQNLLNDSYQHLAEKELQYINNNRPLLVDAHLRRSVRNHYDSFAIF